MKKRWVILLIVGLLLISAGVFVVSAGESITVRTMGGIDFKPNVKISSNLRFSPGPATVESGGMVTWVHADDSGEPHTVTIVDQADLPGTFEEAFVDCAAGPCGAALAGHFSTFPPTLVLEAGAPGLDAPGDSLLFFPGESITATVSAPSGANLYYLCAIHPWMQGVVQVK